jgi:hypothetical protein
VSEVRTKGRYYGIGLKGGAALQGVIREPEALDSIREAPPDKWVWYNDTDGTVWVRAGEVQSIFIGTENYKPG